MKPLLIAVGVAGLLLGLVSSSEAQQSDRIWPIFELTDEDLAQIDIKDGSIWDWEEVVGEPTVTAWDFRTPSDLGAPYDPLSMDFRIWLAWHRSTSHIYVAMERADDHYINEYGTDEYNVVQGQHDSSIQFWVDGDHSGGEFLFPDGEDDRYQQAQRYVAIGEVHGISPHVSIPWFNQSEDWFTYPPYTDGGGGSFGENPTISVTEFYVTPFDRLIDNSPEESVVSDLYPGKIISFAIEVYDVEPEPRRFTSLHYLRAREWGECQPNGNKYASISSSDCFAVGLLLGPGGEIPPGISAVESITWARIKATFVK